MDREDIIRMAREAGLRVGTNLSGVVLVGSPAEIGLAHLTIEELERFAALVAAAEREKLAAWMMERGYATGHGDSIEKLLEELDWQIAEKQEPVTFVCSTGLCRFTLTQTGVGIGDTQAIRARGEQ